MGYKYEEHKPKFKDDYELMTFLEIRCRVKEHIKWRGMVTMMDAINGSSGDAWFLMACVDKLVEIGEISEVKNDQESFGQDRIFVGLR